MKIVCNTNIVSRYSLLLSSICLLFSRHGTMLHLSLYVCETTEILVFLFPSGGLPNAEFVSLPCLKTINKTYLVS